MEVWLDSLNPARNQYHCLWESVQGFPAQQLPSASRKLKTLSTLQESLQPLQPESSKEKKNGLHLISASNLPQWEELDGPNSCPKL